MRELMIWTLVISTGAFLLWLLIAAVAVQELRKRGAPVSHGLTVFLALLGHRPGLRAALYLLRGNYNLGGSMTMSPVVYRARDLGRVIAPGWFVIAGIGSMAWLTGAL
jgi:hypothetical protein